MAVTRSRHRNFRGGKWIYRIGRAVVEIEPTREPPEDMPAVSIARE
jgi:hypothetical protein